MYRVLALFGGQEISVDDESAGTEKHSQVPVETRISVSSSQWSASEETAASKLPTGSPECQSLSR